MRSAIFAGILLVCAGCRTTPPMSFYDEMKFGMSSAELRKVIVDHGGTLDVDRREGDVGLIVAIMRGPEMLGRELTPLVTVIFLHDRMKTFGVEYYFLPHQQHLFISMERCGQIFTQVAGDLVSVYGQPGLRNGEPDGKTKRVIWKWYPDGKFFEVTAFYDGGRCGIIAMDAFDGTETESNGFANTLSTPKPPAPVP